METLRMFLKLVDAVASVLGLLALAAFFWFGFYWATHPIPTDEEYYQQVYGAREAWVKAVRERQKASHADRGQQDSGLSGGEGAPSGRIDRDAAEPNGSAGGDERTGTGAP